jgi:hypothetical protein
MDTSAKPFSAAFANPPAARNKFCKMNEAFGLPALTA